MEKGQSSLDSGCEGEKIDPLLRIPKDPLLELTREFFSSVHQDQQKVEGRKQEETERL